STETFVLLTATLICAASSLAASRPTRSDLFVAILILIKNKNANKIGILIQIILQTKPVI
ncbi:hypothetical protein Q0P29_14090, partial [Staphylococcus aureus]|nr:hypothetical protein [Staphylococcus aureus]